MVFSRLLALSGGGDRGGSSRATTAAQQQQQQPSSTKEASSNSRQGPAAIIPPEYIWDETHLPPPPPQAPDLRDLNSCLEALSVVFPDVQVDVFREMLVSFDGESRLALVADALLKNKVTWVKGRWRVAEPARPSSSSSTGAGRRPARRRGDDSLLRPHEIFRSAEYKAAVLALARHEFKGLSRSAVNAVLAECNYSYLDARPTLVDLSSKTWSFALSSLFRRKRPVTASEAENHPLVVWKSSGLGSIIPCLRSTGNAELDRELFDALIVPLREPAPSRSSSRAAPTATSSASAA
ncbi:hypothetical protein VTK73DRAFT_1202 [Phialemonium thermophilum]|uniref:CUE domain-containing protein n=1 Tax=Phialemonium thermophilum TaxID=223376 RepID=A0ABR3VTW1_9PEZI